MLIRSAWILTPTTATILPRAYSLELVRELHRRMDLTMGEEAIPSVTYAGLVGKTTPCQDFLTFHPEEHYQLVLCGLQEASAKAIAALDLSNSLKFLGATFQVSDRIDEVTSYETLYTTLVANEPEPPRQFRLRFDSPTAFAQNRLRLPLPVPALMFRSWLERWNHFAPVYLGSDELLSYLEEVVALSHHRLQTRSFQVHKSKIPGYVGNTTLHILSRADPLLANVANLLIHYAQFAGTGIKTRLGMGQTQLKL